MVGVNQMDDVLFKICIFGDGGVGKTSLVKRYLDGIFEPEYKITVGVDFHTKKLEIEGKKVTLQIWDFAGEKQFRFILPAYARGSAGGIFMYDITRKSSLESFDDWLNVFTSGTKKEAWEVPILMVGSKLDLEDARDVSIEDATDIATSHDLFGFLEISSKNGANIESLFLIMARAILEKRGIM